MTEFFNGIKDILPCSFNDIFAKEKIQEKIYEKFVYLLHLLQQGKIKYENETKTLYIWIERVDQKNEWNFNFNALT